MGGNATVHCGRRDTHVGKVRPNNEDGYLVRGNLLAVADGMGGHNAGEVASETVLAVLREYPFTADVIGTGRDTFAAVQTSEAGGGRRLRRRAEMETGDAAAPNCTRRFASPTSGCWP